MNPVGKLYNQMLASVVLKLDAASWVIFLSLVVGASFTSGAYIESKWLAFSGVFYIWFALVLLLTQFQPKPHIKAIKASKFIIALLSLSIVWLVLQIHLPFKHELYELLPMLSISGGDAVGWFDPNYIWSVEPDKTRWLALSELLMLSVFISTVWMVNSRKRLKQLLIVFVLLGAFHSVLGLYSKYAGVILVDSKQLDGHWSAARGLFINRNHYGAFVLFSSLGLISLILTILATGFGRQNSVLDSGKSKVTALILFLLSMLSISAIILSESRGVLLSLILGFTFFLSTSKLNFQIKRRYVFTVLLLVVVAGLFFIGEILLQRLVHGSLSLGERGDQWRITIDAILLNPWFGYGGGSYATVFQAFRGESPLREVMYAQAHNHYLHLWLERGLVGLLLWLITFVMVLYRCLSMFKKVRSRLAASALNGCLIIISAALIQSLVDYNLQNLTLRIYFFIAMALVYATPYVRLR